MAGRSIRLQLLGVVLAALLPLTGVGVWQWLVALDVSQKLVATQLRATAWSLVETERDPFIIAEHSLAFAAAQPAIRDMAGSCNTMLADALKNARGIVNFVRTDANGKPRCSVLPFPPNLDVSKDSWWLERQGRRTLYLSKPQIGSVSQQLVHIMVLPLFTSDGTFNGSLSAGIGLQQLGDSIRRKMQGRSGVAMLVSAAGDPITSSRPLALRRLPDVRRAPNALQHTATLDGRRWAYVAVPLFDGELYMVYAEPADVVTRAAWANMWPNILMSLLAILAAAAAIWFASQHLILRWLSRLQQETARFARGDYATGKQQFTGAPVEIAAFADDLYRMADTIADNERSLRATLATKEALSREVNHRVKNNLQIVTSLLSMHAERMNDAQTQAALNQARARVAALGLIHRLLYESEENEQTGKIAVAHLVSGLCAQLRASQRASKHVTVTCRSDPADINADQAVPFALFIVETVTNAFQHAFIARQSGSIQVDFAMDGETAQLRIADDGRGLLRADSQQNLGMQLAHAFAEQLGGSAIFDSGSQGVVVTLRFPLADSKG
jgi:two-component sensor histidine kinase